MPRTIDYAAPGQPPGNDYWAKLAKYVPAEVVAVFIPVMAAWNTSKAEAAGVLVAGAGLNLLYHYWRSLNENTRLRKFFWVLATIAFGCWAIGTSADAQRLVGLSATKAAAILAAAAFLVPMVDDIVDKRWPMGTYPFQAQLRRWLGGNASE